MKRRHTAAVAAASAILASAIGVVAAPPASAGVPVTAHAAIGVTYPNGTTFRVCPNGLVDDGTSVVGEWLFDVEGARSDGSVIHVVQTGSGPSFAPGCIDIVTNATAAGTFVATLWYAGVGSAGTSKTTGTDTKTIPDFVALAGVAADWTPQQDAIGFGM